MRVEANVSLRPRGTEAFGTRVEVKNMNSFRSVERAIAYEIERQGRALDAGEPLTMETRGWDDGRQATYRMRSKETSDDYRYFPEPDLPPLHVDPAWIARVRDGLPELPGGAPGALRGAGHHRLRRGRPGRGPGDDRRVRGDRRGRGRAGAGEGGLELRDRRRTRGRPRRAGSTPPGPRARRRRTGSRRCWRRSSTGPVGRPVGPRPARAAPRGRHAGRGPARRRRSGPDLRRRRAPGARRRGDRGEPQGRRRTTGRASPSPGSSWAR